MKFEFRGRCPICKTTRPIFGPRVVEFASDLEAMEKEIDQRGGVIAKCVDCDGLLQVAMFLDDQQTEHWQDAENYEQDNGPSAGELPPKPWGDA